MISDTILYVLHDTFESLQNDTTNAIHAYENFERNRNKEFHDDLMDYINRLSTSLNATKRILNESIRLVDYVHEDLKDAPIEECAGRNV